MITATYNIPSECISETEILSAVKENLLAEKGYVSQWDAQLNCERKIWMHYR